MSRTFRPRMGEPSLTEDGVLQVASFDDLMATKLKVLLQRAEARDYRDIAAMIGDLGTLTKAEKNALVGAVKAVRELPRVTLLSERLGRSD